MHGDLKGSFGRTFFWNFFSLFRKKVKLYFNSHFLLEIPSVCLKKKMDTKDMIFFVVFVFILGNENHKNLWEFVLLMVELFKPSSLNCQNLKSKLSYCILFYVLQRKKFSQSFIYCGFSSNTFFSKSQHFYLDQLIIQKKKKFIKTIGMVRGHSEMTSR